MDTHEKNKYLPEGALYWYGNKLYDFTAYSNSGSITYNTNNIYLSASGYSSYETILTTNDLYLSNYTKLKASVYGSTNGVVVASTGYYGNTWQSYSAYDSFSGMGNWTLDCDISSLTGNYYVGYSVDLPSTQSDNRTMNIYSIWLE